VRMILLVVSCAIVLASVAFMPGPALAQKDPNVEAVNDIDALKGMNGINDKLKALDKKGANRTKKENEEKDHLERQKTRMEEGLQQQLQGAAQGFGPLDAETIKKIREYFELQQVEKELADEEKKGARARQRRIAALKARLEVLDPEHYPKTPAAAAPSVRTATGLTIVDGPCDEPKCTVGR